MRLLIAVFTALLSFVSSASSEDTKLTLNQWLDQEYEQELQRSPLTLTIYGRKDKYDQVDARTVQASLAEIDTLVDSVERMEKHYDYKTLSPQEQMSYDFWKFRAESETAQRPFQYHAYTFNQFRAPHTYPVGFLLNYHQVDSEADMLAYIERVKGLSRALGEAVVISKKSAQMGIRPPLFAYESVLAESRKVIAGKPFDDSAKDSVIWADGSAKIAALVKSGEIDGARQRELSDRLEKNLLN